MILLATFLIIPLFFILFLLVNSPGKLPPLKTERGLAYPNGLTEKIKLQIGGIDQGLFIMSEAPDNPVLLFLHGGPGSPELPLIYTKNNAHRLENEFTVCYWDQRGAGMSLKDVPESSMNIEQLIADVLELTAYLQQRFKQEKIFLMGHSWGSFLGVKTIGQAPEHFHAYIGMGQIADQRLSETLAYDYLVEHATQINDQKALKSLKKCNVNDPAFPQLSYIMGVRTSLMNQYGIGITHEKYSMLTILKQLILFKGYTLIEKVNFMRGSLFSLKHLFHYTTEEKLNETERTFPLPFYVIQGKYDYQVSWELAKKYYEIVQSPHKKFYTFENSAHSPIIEEREAFSRVMKEIKDNTLLK